MLFIISAFSFLVAFASVLVICLQVFSSLIREKQRYSLSLSFSTQFNLQVSDQQKISRQLLKFIHPYLAYFQSVNSTLAKFLGGHSQGILLRNQKYEQPSSPRQIIFYINFSFFILWNSSIKACSKRLKIYSYMQAFIS